MALYECIYCDRDRGLLLDAVSRAIPCEVCVAKLSRLLGAMPDPTTTCGLASPDQAGWCGKPLGHAVEDERGRVADPEHEAKVGLGSISWTAKLAPERPDKRYRHGARPDVEGILTLEQAKNTRCCRVCGKSTTLAGAAIIFAFGKEHAHENCLNEQEKP